MNSLFQITLLVKEYNEAIEFYTKVLDFELVEDTQISETKRWVRVQPKGNSGASLLLAKASKTEQIPYIGNQTGSRVFLFIHTNNLERDYKKLIERRVEIVRGPSNEEYGKVLVFKDLYGNLIDLIEPV